MPLAGTGTALGTAMATAAGSLDGVGQATWKLIAASLCSQIPGLATFAPTGPVPLVATGAAVAGKGSLTMAPGSAMGPGLAAAAGSLDAVGQARWAAIGLALTTWMAANAQYASGFIGYVGTAPPGPVTGSGKLSFVAPPGDVLAVAAGSLDAAGITAWTNIAAAIHTHLTANLTVAPTTLVNPGTGGPIVGAATVS